ncbi:MAG: PIG-L family deacetylase [Promicromonosporaceae bacterium]|nr:PIG-L family deacetylase [Promicromonosporaceae bacterium]
MNEHAGALLAVHAHPDDETLFTGALIASWAAAGQQVTVVTCTRGERGEVIALPGTATQGRADLEGDHSGLARWRTQELAAALAALQGTCPGPGVSGVFLDRLPPDDGARYRDSGYHLREDGEVLPEPDGKDSFCQADLEESAGRLARLIRELRPAVVATYEWTGGYGHPDHLRVHEVTVRALEFSADPAWGTGEAWKPALWQRVPSAQEADPAGPWTPIRPMQTERIRVWPAELCLEVPVRPVIEQMLAALRCHASQVQGVHRAATRHPGDALGWYALSNNLVTPILDVETYYLAP